MFEVSEEIGAMVDQLFEAARPLDRGDVIDHSVIVEILGVDPHEGHWQHCMGKFKRKMERERGIAVWPEHTIGYKLCTVQEQLDLAHEYQVRARRRIKRGIRALAALPRTGLTMRQRELRHLQGANLAKSHLQLSSHIHQKLPTNRVSQTLPRSRPSRD